MAKMTDVVITKEGEHWLKPVAAGVRPIVAIVIMLLSVVASAQTPLTEWIPQSLIAKPCQYFVDGVERLEWETRKGKENRFFFFWNMQNQAGQTGQCNPLKGFDDSCARVSWVARVKTKRELTGWVYPDTVQAVYHFDGGIAPEEFCYGAG